MKKKKTLIISCFFLSVLVGCGSIWWWFPTHILEEIETNKISIIKVVNKNSGNEFEITDSNDVSIIVEGIGEKTFRKKSVNSENIAYWYQLTFYGENGKEIETLDIQNKHIVADGLFCREIDGLFCRSSPDIIVRRRCVLSHKRRGWLQPSPSFRYSRNLALQDELYHPVINNGPAVLVCVDKRLGTGPVNQSRDAG